MNTIDAAIDLLDPDPRQPREAIRPEQVTPLAKSIRDQGQLQPLIVYRRGGRFVVLDGHCRLAALRMLKASVAHCIVLDEEPDADAKLMAQLAANCLRIDLNPLEKGRAFARLMQAKGWNQQQLAGAIHLSEAMISQSLALVKAPAEVQAGVERGEIAPSTAYYVSRTEGAVRDRLVEQAKAGELTRATAQAAATGKRPPRRRRRRVVCRLPKVDVVYVGESTCSLGDLEATLRQLLKQVRRGIAQGWDVQTLERVLADQGRVERAKV